MAGLRCSGFDEYEYVYRDPVGFCWDRQIDLCKQLENVIDTLQVLVKCNKQEQSAIIQLHEEFTSKKRTLQHHIEDLQFIADDCKTRVVPFPEPEIAEESQEEVPFHPSCDPDQFVEEDRNPPPFFLRYGYGCSLPRPRSDGWLDHKAVKDLPQLSVFAAATPPRDTPIASTTNDEDVVVLGTGDTPVNDALPDIDAGLIEDDARHESVPIRVAEWLTQQDFNAEDVSVADVSLVEQEQSSNQIQANNPPSNKPSVPPVASQMPTANRNAAVFTAANRNAALATAANRHAAVTTPSKISANGNVAVATATNRNAAVVTPCKISPEELKDWASATAYPAVSYTFDEEHLVLCEVALVCSPLEIGLIPFEFMDRVKEIYRKLEAYGNLLTDTDAMPEDMMKEGLPCAVRFKGVFRRGLILNVAADDCRVHFVDVGCDKIVEKNSIFFLPDSLSVVQPTAFICCINKVDSRELSTEKTTKFQSEVLFVGQQVLVQGVRGRPGYQGRPRVEIFDRNERNLASEYQSSKKSSSSGGSFSTPSTQTGSSSRILDASRVSSSPRFGRTEEECSEVASTFGGISFGLRSEIATPFSETTTTERVNTPGTVTSERRRDGYASVTMA